MHEYRYKPAKFFVSTLLATWTLWSLAAYCSYQPSAEALLFLCMMFGSLAPFFVALMMIFGAKNKELKNDFARRFNILLIKPRYTPVIFLLMPASILLSIAVSLLFGQPADQFRVANEFGIMTGQAFLSLLISILAPTSEELGWRGYGVDSLKSGFSLFKTSVVFALLWSIWHLPLFFIKDYYQNQLWQSGVLYVLNFFVSIVPLTFILNWLYYKNNRSIWAAVLFHIMTVISAEAFSTLESTKFIQTIILLVVAVGIVLYDKPFFMGNPKQLEKSPSLAS